MCNSVEPSDLTVQGTVTLSMFGICEALRSGTKIQTNQTLCAIEQITILLLL